MSSGIGTVVRLAWMESLRRKDAYVLLALLVALLLLLSLYETPVDTPSVRYVLDAGLLVVWIFSLVLAVILAGRPLAADLGSGMILALLSKPLDRRGWLIGKWIGAWSVAVLATLIFYTAVAAVSFLRGGGLESPATWGQAFLLHVGALAVVTSLTLALSTRLTAGATLAVGLILALAGWLFLPAMGRQAAETGGGGGTILQALTFALPHLEIMDLRRRVVHVWGPARATLVALSFLYAVAWSGLGLLFAWLGFRHRPLGRADT
jgi:ABC-type transport system involved in multi-copper enzyme maturation permease subunit